METKTIIQLKDEKAISKGYKDWLDLLYGFRNKKVTALQLEALENEVSKAYVKQMCEEQRMICVKEWADALIHNESEAILNAPLPEGL